MKKSREVCVPPETWKDGLPNSCSWCKTTTCGQHYKHEESPNCHFRYTTVKQHFFTQPLHTHRISLSLCHHYQSPRTILLTCNRTKFFPQLPKGWSLLSLLVPPCTFTWEAHNSSIKVPQRQVGFINIVTGTSSWSPGTLLDYFSSMCFVLINNILLNLLCVQMYFSSANFCVCLTCMLLFYCRF